MRMAGYLGRSNLWPSRHEINEEQQHVFYFVNEAERFVLVWMNCESNHDLAGGKTFDWDSCQNLRCEAFASLNDPLACADITSRTRCNLSESPTMSHTEHDALRLPIAFQPVYMEIVWGGQRLSQQRSGDVPTGATLAKVGIWRITHAACRW